MAVGAEEMEAAAPMAHADVPQAVAVLAPCPERK